MPSHIENSHETLQYLYFSICPICYSVDQLRSPIGDCFYYFNCALLSRML